MNRYAILDDDGFVVNVILWDGESEYDPDGNLRLLPDDSGVGIGWQRVGRRWTAPPEPPEPIAPVEA